MRNPFNVSRAVTLSPKEFHYVFTNVLAEREAREVYTRCAMPAPGLPVFQLALAIVNLNGASRVHQANALRGPLLLMAGEKDHAIPASWVKSTLTTYRDSPAVTDFKLFANRGHSLTIDSGWRELAESCVIWLQGKGF